MPSSRTRYSGFLLARPDASQVAWPPTPPSLCARPGASAHAGRFYEEESCPRAAARRSGAGLTADSHASPSTGRERGHPRRRTRPWLVGTYKPVRSRKGRQPPRRGQVEDQAKASWRTRTGAMRGGSATSLRGQRIFRITSPCVMAAMIRSDPCCQNGQRAMSRANTRLSNHARLQGDVPVFVSSSSTPCWRSVGMIAPRRQLWGAKQPP
jgi:hypothetical protein